MRRKLFCCFIYPHRPRSLPLLSCLMIFPAAAIIAVLFMAAVCQTQVPGSMWVANLAVGSGATLQHMGSAQGPSATYVFGYFNNNLLQVFSGDGTLAFNLTNGGDTSHAGFLVAYSLTGTALWAIRANSPNSDAVTGVSVSPQGSLYVIGSCFGTLTLYHRNGSAARNVQLNGAGNAMFVAKYDSSGTVQWAISANFGAMDVFTSPSVSADAFDNVFLALPVLATTTRFYDSSNVNVKNVSQSSADWEGIVAKYNPSGVLQWTTNIGGSLNDVTRSASVDLSSNQLLVGGWYFSAQHTHYNIDGGIGARFTDGSGSYFHCQYARYSTSGSVLWASGVNGTAECRVHTVAADNAGSSVVTGFFRGTSDFRHSNRTIFRTSSANGLADAYVISTTSAGDVRWVAIIGGSGSELCFGVVADSSNNVIVTCTSTSTTIVVNHANGTVATNMTASSNARLLVKYSPTGVVLWAVRSVYRTNI